MESFVNEVLFFITLKTLYYFDVRKEAKKLSISETVLVALFVMAVVFTVLGILWVIIKIFSFIIRGIEENKSCFKNESR